MSESRIAFLSAPVVKLVSSPRFHEATLAEAITVIPGSVTSAADGDALAEVGGRICYDSFAAPRPGGNKGYIAHIKEVGHGSVLEHPNFTFLLAGISRPCAQQITRHRAGFGFSMRSQRYVDESNGAIVIPPEYLAPDAHEEHNAFVSVCANQWAAYRELVERTTARIVSQTTGALFDGKELSREQRTEIRKRARQAARGALPLNTATALVITANARAWRHFVEERGSVHADIEIRGVAISVLLVLRRAAPNIFGDYEIRAEPKPVSLMNADDRRKVDSHTWPVGTAWAPGTIHTDTRKV